MTDALHRLLDFERIEDFSLALDIGAGTGAWSALMAVHFGRVVAYEADREAYDAILVACGELGNVDLHHREVLCGPGFLKIDDLELDQCGLIRIGAAGDEVLVLRGAERTIRRCSPVVIIECAGRVSRQGHPPRAAAGWIIGLGYRELLRAGADRVFVSN